MATVRPDDEFWLTYEGESHLLPRDQGVALLRAMATAQPREFRRGYFYRGTFPPSAPPMKAKLVWCKDWEDQREIRGNVLWIRSRNELISYEGKAYIVPAEGREILDRMFPLEEEKVTATISGGEKTSETNGTATGVSVRSQNVDATKNDTAR